MPVDVRILVRLNYAPSEHELETWNQQILQGFAGKYFLDNKPLVILEGWEYNILSEYPQFIWFESKWVANYYGVGYERGILPDILAYVEAIEEIIPRAELYYGPDSVDEIEPFDQSRRSVLKAHWDRVRHEPYHLFLYGNNSSLPSIADEVTLVSDQTASDEKCGVGSEESEELVGYRPQLWICRPLHSIPSLGGTLLCLTMASFGVFFFHRIANGQLFLFALPWETPPSASELRSANELGNWLLLAPIPISAGIWLFLSYCRFRPFDGLSRMNVVGITLVILQSLAIIATMLDCWSTVLLVSRFGVDGEVHPGIASFCYMFGRTLGTVFGKTFQWVCMQFIVAAVSVRWRFVILSVFILAGMLASLWNFRQVMELMVVE